MTARASWNGVVLAESDDTIIVEGNHYFPLDSVKRELMSGSDTHTHCSWKGDASYYNVSAGGEENRDAAWYYPEPMPAADVIRDYVAVLARRRGHFGAGGRPRRTQPPGALTPALPRAEYEAEGRRTERSSALLARCAPARRRPHPGPPRTRLPPLDNAGAASIATIPVQIGWWVIA